MGLKDRFRKFWGDADPATAPNGETTAAAGRSDLALAAEKLSEMRGDAVPSGGTPAHRPQDDNIAKLVESANAIRNPEMSTGGKVVDNSSDHGLT